MDIIYEDYPNNGLTFKVLVAAGIIIKNNPETGEDELLLIQRSPADKWPLLWEIPRGKCDLQKSGENEKILHCLKREVKEEVGLDIKPVKLIDVFEYSSKDRKRRAIQYNYLCRIIGDDHIILSSEHINYRWVKSMSEVQLMLSNELVKVIAQIFNEDDKIINYPDEILPVEEKLNNYLGKL